MHDTNSLTQTTSSLLFGLGEPNNDSAWRALYERCAPIMAAVAKRMRTPPDAIPDLVQSSLLEFLQAWRSGKYDRRRGRISTFLLVILRSRIADARRRMATAPPTSLVGSAFDHAVAPEELDLLWREERRNQILAVALDTLRQEGFEAQTLEAFDLITVRQAPVDAVADRLGMSRDDVYNAKYRVTRRLKPLVARLDEVYEDV